MYAEGLEHYKTIPEMKGLEKVHINLHETVKNIVSLKNEGKTAGRRVPEDLTDLRRNHQSSHGDRKEGFRNRVTVVLASSPDVML